MKEVIGMDASHYLFRMVFMNSKEIKESPNFLAHLLMNGFLSVARDFGASKSKPIYLAVDSKPTWRHEWYVENLPPGDVYRSRNYKGSRVKDDSMPWKEIFSVYGDVCSTLRDYSDFRVVAVPGAEADDIIGWLAFEAKKHSRKFVIVSSDKDFNQLVGQGVLKYDPIKKIFVDIDDPTLQLEMHIILGDKGDEIFPVRDGRFGPATAEKVYKSLGSLLKTDPVLRERYEFNKKLIDLSLTPDEIKNKIKLSVEEEQGSYNQMGLSKICQKYNLRKMMERLSEFNFPENRRSALIENHFKTLNAARNNTESSLESFF